MEQAWIIIYDKLGKYQEYYLCNSLDNLSRTIERGWKDNLCVEKVSWGGGVWVLVLEEDESGKQVSYDLYEKIPKIEDIWERGESIDAACTNGKEWLIVSSLQESKRCKDSHFLYTEEFPLNWLHNFVWAKKALISPYEIKFSLEKAPHCFDDGQKLDKLIDLLKKKKIHQIDFPLMRVVMFSEEIYTLNNRRLFCFQQGMKDYDEEDQLITILFTEDLDEFKLKHSTSSSNGVSLELFCFGESCPCKKLDHRNSMNYMNQLKSNKLEDNIKNFNFSSNHNNSSNNQNKSVNKTIEDPSIEEMRYDSELISDQLTPNQHHHHSNKKQKENPEKFQEESKNPQTFQGFASPSKKKGATKNDDDHSKANQKDSDPPSSSINQDIIKEKIRLMKLDKEKKRIEEEKNNPTIESPLKELSQSDNNSSTNESKKKNSGGDEVLGFNLSDSSSDKDDKIYYDFSKDLWVHPRTKVGFEKRRDLLDYLEKQK